MSEQHYDQSNASGPWIDVKEYIYPSRRHRVLRQHHATETDHRGKPKKRFLQFHSTGNGHWEKGAPDMFELYVKPDAQNVIHVEGEACAEFVNEKLREAGIKDWIATTSSGGSKAWRLELAKDYKGKYVWGSPDWDEDGYAYLNKVMLSAQTSGALATMVVEVEGKAPGDDLKDWLQRDGNTITKWIELARASPKWSTTWTPSLWKTAVDLGEWDDGDDDEPIPARGWLYANVFCRGFASSLIADGGTGKTALRYVQALSLAIGRSLIGEHVFQRCRVLIVSFEDGRDELRRRIRAARIHYGVSSADTKGWLFLAAVGREAGKLLTVSAKGGTVVGSLANNLRAVIRKRNIDLVILDPFVKTHGVEENANSAMDEVTQILSELATEENIAVDFPHHTSKGRAAVPGDADRGRGATAVKDGARLVYTLTTMTTEEAKAFGVPEGERRLYIRMDSAKVNITPPARNATWFQLVGVPLGNSNELYPSGDNVQTVERWTPPATFEGVTTDLTKRILDEIAAGLPDGVLFSNASSAKGRAAWRVVQKHMPGKTEAQCREIVNMWVKNGALVVSPYHDKREGKDLQGLKVGSDSTP